MILIRKSRQPEYTRRALFELARRVMVSLREKPRTVADLAVVLGEDRKRVQRVLTDLQAAGWPVESQAGARGMRRGVVARVWSCKEGTRC